MTIELLDGEQNDETETEVCSVIINVYNHNIVFLKRNVGLTPYTSPH